MLKESAEGGERIRQIKLYVTKQSFEELRKEEINLELHNDVKLTGESEIEHKKVPSQSVDREALKKVFLNLVESEEEINFPRSETKRLFDYVRVLQGQNRVYFLPPMASIGKTTYRLKLDSFLMI